MDEQNGMQLPSSLGAINVTLQQLGYFLSAVEHGSLSAAAEANFIAQPSLSEQIRRMERSLGVNLFIRTNRSLILTDAARTLVPHAEKTLAAAYGAVQSLAPVRDLTGGKVTFGTFSTAPHLFHRSLVERFRNDYPGVSIRLIGDSSVKLAEEVREGRIEAAVVILPVDDRGLDTEPLEWSPQMYYFSRNATSVTEPKTIEAITAATLVMPEAEWGDSDPTRRRLMGAAQQEGLKLEPIIEVSPYTALELTAAGLADTIAPYPLAAATGMTRSLHWAPLSPPIRENYGFVKRRNASLSPGALAVKSIIAGLIHGIPSDAPE